MTKNNSQHLDAIKDIRNMMQKSTRFLSLSGLSGIFAGVFALIGGGIAYGYAKHISDHNTYTGDGTATFSKEEVYFNFILIAVCILTLSVITAYYLSNKKAKQQGVSLFDKTAMQVFINLFIPLATGGIFCLALLFNGSTYFIAPVMLLFYGLALVNASKFTYDDVKYLGLLEIVLGLINAFNLNNGLIYWMIGFGVLHIVYGTVMWVKYEKK